MRSNDPFELTDETPVYVISVAAQLSGLHPQTLRQYDRLGLVSPGRSQGRGRRYSARDIELLRQVQQLSQIEGINLAGVKRILELEARVAELRAQVLALRDELETVRALAAQGVAEAHRAHRRELVPLPEVGLAVWRPPNRQQYEPPRGPGSP